MSLPNLRRVSSLMIVMATVVGAFVPFMNSARAAGQEAAWINFVPPDEEFVLSIPAQPTVQSYPVSIPRDGTVERTVSHVAYSGYGDGLVFILHSFKAKHPQKLPVNYLGYLDQDTTLEREVTIDGLTAKMNRRTVSNTRGSYTLRTLRFVTEKHVYVLTLATLEEINSAVERFLAAMQWHRVNSQVTSIKPPPDNAPGPVFSPLEVNRRAVIVWKSEPSYTDEARQYKTKGQVVLEVVFAENGYVTDIKVTKGLSHGLNEAAINAARNIRFFPAQKDGKPASQRMMLEYGFDIY